MTKELTPLEEVLANCVRSGSTENTDNKSYSIFSSHSGKQASFLELRFRNGLRTCFSYSDLMWFNYDPDSSCLDMQFGGFLVTITGTGLHLDLFAGIKGKRVTSINEPESESEDHSSEEVFVKGITLVPPKEFMIAE